MTRSIKQFPHCDSAILHAKGECQHCDAHPDWQELRETWGINFTGHHDPDKMICPAQRARPLDTINAWGGNVPETVERKAARDAEWADLKEKWKEDFELAEAAKEIPAKGERLGFHINTGSVEPLEVLKKVLAILKGSSPAKPPEPCFPAGTDPDSQSWPEKPKATLSGRPAELPTSAPAPAPIDPRTGMHKDYWVLPESERAKGFVRPYRDSYRHVGDRPKYPLRDLTPEEKSAGEKYGYVKYEEYPESMRPLVGRSWAKKDLDRRGCGTVTVMGRALSETYARDPNYYGSTFCCGCGSHYPVREFVWTADGDVLGS